MSKSPVVALPPSFRFLGAFVADTESGTPPVVTLTKAPPPLLLCVESVGGSTEPAEGVRCGGMPCGPDGVRSGEASKGATEVGLVGKREVLSDKEGSNSVGGPNRRTPGLTKVPNEINDFRKYSIKGYM